MLPVLRVFNQVLISLHDLNVLVQMFPPHISAAFFQLSFRVSLKIHFMLYCSLLVLQSDVSAVLYTVLILPFRLRFV